MFYFFFFKIAIDGIVGDLFQNDKGDKSMIKLIFPRMITQKHLKMLNILQ